MDSFVLAETFKYLYLLFSEESEHTINIHDFIFTTEAHLLPLYLSQQPAPPTNAAEFAEVIIMLLYIKNFFLSHSCYEFMLLETRNYSFGKLCSKKNLDL